jgi:hypothetical protein
MGNGDFGLVAVRVEKSERIPKVKIQPQKRSRKIENRNAASDFFQRKQVPSNRIHISTIPF